VRSEIEKRSGGGGERKEHGDEKRESNIANRHYKGQAVFHSNAKQGNKENMKADHHPREVYVAASKPGGVIAG